MNSKSPEKTSIVIVNYNTSRQIIECLKSLRHESVNKIVVVDNASPNDNPESILSAFPSVVLLKNTVNTGFGEGCNSGMEWVLKNTDSSFILLLNPDTIAEPGLISQLESRMTDDKIGIVTPRITMMPETDLIWYGGGYFSWLKGSARIPGYGKSSTSQTALRERDVQFASGCALMIRRTVVEKCGGFDPDYFMYEEDVELSLRVLSNGYRIRYNPNAVVHHSRQGSQSGEKSLAMFDGKNPRLTYYVYYAARNRFRTVFKHGNFFRRIIFIVGFIGWILRKSVNWIVNGRFDAFRSLLKGISDFMIKK